jgi:uncharacterized peroxidase-related enzyme
MALVSYVSKDDAAEAVRPVLEGMEKKLGSVPSIYGMLAHSPELFQGFLAFNSALSKTKLDGKLRELAYIKTSELNGCSYCLAYHRGFGQKAGLTERQIHETGRFEDSDAYDELQRDVLRYAEEVTRHINVSEPLIQRLRQKLSDREIVELAITVATANLTNRLTETLKLEYP